MEGDRAEKMFENFDNCDTNRRFIYERFDKLLPRKLRLDFLLSKLHNRTF